MGVKSVPEISQSFLASLACIEYTCVRCEGANLCAEYRSAKRGSRRVRRRWLWCGLKSIPCDMTMLVGVYVEDTKGE